MEASEKDKMPDSEVLAQVASHPRNMFLLTHDFVIDDVCILLLFAGSRM